MSRATSFFALGAGGALFVGWFGLARILYEAEAQPLQFSHVVHTETTGQRCEDCHRFDATGRFLGIPAIETCAACHAEPLGDSENERTLVEEYVRPGREIAWRVYARQPELAWFPHVHHVKLAGLACERCHGPHGTSDRLRPYARDRLSGASRDLRDPSIRAARSGSRMGDCSGCHRESGVTESCLDCHR